MDSAQVDPMQGLQAPDFCLPDMENRKICLKDFRGRFLVLYFYPKDNTSGCTLEAKMFNEDIEKIKEMGTEVIGISPDSTGSHQKFSQKLGLGFPLLSDPDHSVLSAYQVWKEKKMYGKSYMGVERSTFIIDTDGVIIAVWRKVKVKDHVDEVINSLKLLKT